MMNRATVNNWVASEIDFFGMGSYTSELKLDAKFEYFYIDEAVEYTYSETQEGKLPKSSFGLQYAGLESKEQATEIPVEKLGGNGGGSTSGGGLKYGYGWSNRIIDLENKDDRTIEAGGGAYMLFDVETIEMEYPNYYFVRVYWDGNVVEEFILE